MENKHKHAITGMMVNIEFNKPINKFKEEDFPVPGIFKITFNNGKTVKFDFETTQFQTVLSPTVIQYGFCDIDVFDGQEITKDDVKSIWEATFDEFNVYFDENIPGYISATKILDLSLDVLTSGIGINRLMDNDFLERINIVNLHENDN